MDSRKKIERSYAVLDIEERAAKESGWWIEQGRKLFNKGSENKNRFIKRFGLKIMTEGLIMQNPLRKRIE